MNSVTVGIPVGERGVTLFSPLRTETEIIGENVFEAETFSLVDSENNRSCS